MTKTEYIQKMYAILSPMCAKYGYHNVAAGMIAQSIQEGWNSGLATKYFNYWGMKAGSKYSGKTVAMNNKAKNDPAIYRVYTSMANGCEGYFIFLAYPRYAALKNCTNDIDYLDKIGPCGWNGNKGYGDRCKSHLKEVYAALNQTTVQPTPAPQIVEGYEIGKTYTTQQDLYIRDAANGAKIDWFSITKNAQLNAFTDAEGFSILRKGTRVTCKNVKKIGSTVWMNIPSGWICARNSAHIYIT